MGVILPRLPARRAQRWSGWLVAAAQFVKAQSDRRPFGRGDAEPDGVPGLAVRAEPVRAEDPLEAGAHPRPRSTPGAARRCGRRWRPTGSRPAAGPASPAGCRWPTRTAWPRHSPRQAGPWPRGSGSASPRGPASGSASPAWTRRTRRRSRPISPGHCGTGPRAWTEIRTVARSERDPAEGQLPGAPPYPYSPRAPSVSATARQRPHGNSTDGTSLSPEQQRWSIDAVCGGSGIRGSLCWRCRSD
jgi:hypothetical protein